MNPASILLTTGDVPLLSTGSAGKGYIIQRLGHGTRRLFKAGDVGGTRYLYATGEENQGGDESKSSDDQVLSAFGPRYQTIGIHSIRKSMSSTSFQSQAGRSFWRYSYPIHYNWTE
jgi:hypothetical protein